MGPDLVFLVPIVALLSTAAVIIAHSPVAKTLARRAGGGEPDAALQQAFHEQTARLTVAEDEIQKLSERLEFTERLIASRPAPHAVAGPGQPASLSAPVDE